MLTIPANAVLTPSGFRILNGKYWTRYKKYNCTNCGKRLYACNQNRSYSKGKSFCCKACQSIYRHNQVDPIGANILQKEGSAEFSYLIGLAATDGHISYPPVYVHWCCNIGLKDLELIEQLKEIFGGRITHPFLHLWSLNNIQFVNYLKDIGFTHDKSFTIDVSNWFFKLSENNKRHFLRGVVDGDGTICKNKRGQWRAGIVSASKVFIDMIHDYIKVGSIHKDRNCFSLQIYNKKDIELFLDMIYTKNNLKLDRKYQLYKQFKTEIKLC